MLTYFYTDASRYVLDKRSEPRVVSDILYFKSSLRIGVKNSMEKLTSQGRNEFWNRKITSHYFFIECSCIGILEG